MSPTIKDGTVLLVHMNEQLRFEIGDIVSFIDKETSEFTTHRILNDDAHTKGDSSFYRDTVGSTKQAKVLGYILNEKEYIYWGEKGQPLKKYLADLSSRSVKSSKLRHFFFILLVICSRLSSLISFFSNTKFTKDLHLN